MKYGGDNPIIKAFVNASPEEVDEAINYLHDHYGNNLIVWLQIRATDKEVTHA